MHRVHIMHAALGYNHNFECCMPHRAIARVQVGFRKITLAGQCPRQSHCQSRRLHRPPLAHLPPPATAVTGGATWVLTWPPNCLQEAMFVKLKLQLLLSSLLLQCPSRRLPLNQLQPGAPGSQRVLAWPCPAKASAKQRWLRELSRVSLLRTPRRLTRPGVFSPGPHPVWRRALPQVSAPSRALASESPRCCPPPPRPWCHAP
mmetsp:Transcript_110417/g.263185  ORF Transcript_110417/g.263185 Transcript_110417/m.263185 type:complete len:203 (+) Transcript_110417:151-759(+)